MRIGVFGGTFDPVHFGHLILAEQCREQARLDLVLFVPAARHALKTDHAVTPFEDRVAMLRLATAGNDGFRIDELERVRAGPSYTADTLDELHARWPDAELFFLLGSDSLPDLPRWYDPQRIVRRAALVVMERVGTPVMSREALAGSLSLPADAVRLEAVDVPLFDLSSRELRRRVREGRSVRYMLPAVVEQYVREKNLYVRDR
jgi:nicotinate-nucleotide adenylyltransferase